MFQTRAADVILSLAGVQYFIVGTHRFTLGNGISFSIYVSPYTPKFGDYAFMYCFHEDHFSSRKTQPPKKKQLSQSQYQKDSTSS